MTSLVWLVIGIVVVSTTLWIALAIHYHFRQPWLRYLVSLVPLFVVGMAMGLLPFFPWAFVVWFGVLVLAIAWWFSLRPRSDHDWAVGMNLLPQAEVRGDTLHVKNFRNFSYTENGKPIPCYEERDFDLSQLSSIDYFMSHWSGPVMAHTLVSFGFGDQKFLCVSVEARRQQWQRYSPLWGLFRSYELMFALGEERDIVRLRTNIRREQVYKYRLRLPPQNLRRLLLDYITRIDKLATKPEWYNSFTSNCTTNLFYHRHAEVPWWLMPQIFLNGLSARAMYRLGFLDNQLPFEELQGRCAIRERALGAGNAEDFSSRIRASNDVLASP